MRLLFTLGHQPHISIAEIYSVFHTLQTPISLLKQTKDSLFLETPPIDFEELMTILGSTVSISEQVELITKDPEEQIAAYLDRTMSVGKIKFSLRSEKQSQLAIQTKKILTEAGRSVRYIEHKNTATVLHNNLIDTQTDLQIVDNTLFVTRAIQPIEAFSERDFGRPGSDSVSGMLPPKLARTMINLGEVYPNTPLLDPFCGSGTVLTEALSLGFTKIYGSDLSEKAVDDTEKNIFWLLDTEKKADDDKIYTRVSQTDVRDVPKQFSKESVGIIVSEPYMGKPLHGHESEIQLKKQFHELTTLYTDAFKAFHRVLKPDGVVVFIIPRFLSRNQWITIDCIRDILSLGYRLDPFRVGNSTTDSLLYHRPNQHVGREIFRFIKN